MPKPRKTALRDVEVFRNWVAPMGEGGPLFGLSVLTPDESTHKTFARLCSALRIPISRRDGAAFGTLPSGRYVVIDTAHKGMPFAIGEKKRRLYSVEPASPVRVLPKQEAFAIIKEIYDRVCWDYLWEQMNNEEEQESSPKMRILREHDEASGHRES